VEVRHVGDARAAIPTSNAFGRDNSRALATYSLLSMNQAFAQRAATTADRVRRDDTVRILPDISFVDAAE
jgi:hypothetical protein